MTDKTGVLDSFHLGEVLKGSARKLGERCGPAAVEMLSRRFADCIGQPDEDRYSYLWRSAIEEHPQDAHKDSFRAVLVDAIRDVTLGALSTNRAESLNAVRGLLESPYPTLVRIGIYVCGEDYGTREYFSGSVPSPTGFSISPIGMNSSGSLRKPSPGFRPPKDLNIWP